MRRDFLKPILTIPEGFVDHLNTIEEAARELEEEILDEALLVALGRRRISLLKTKIYAWSKLWNAWYHLQKRMPELP